MGAVDACASSTILIIWFRVVSEPTVVALNLNMPVLFNVAPITLSPTFFSTGIDSPVIIFSSTEECPSVMTPSAGIFSPGLTTTISSFINDSAGISTSSLRTPNSEL